MAWRCPELLHSLLPLYYFSHAVGIATFNVSCVNGTVRVSEIKHLLAKGVLKVILFQLYFTPFRYIWVSSAEDGLTTIVDSSQVVITVTCANFMIIFNSLHQHKTMRFIRQLTEFETRLRGLGQGIDCRKSFGACLGICAGVLGSTLWVQAYDFCTNEDNWRDNKIRYIFGYYVSVLILNALDCQFGCFLYILRKQFQVLNGHLVRESLYVGACAERALVICKYKHFASIAELFKLHHDICGGTKLLMSMFCWQYLVKIPLYFMSVSNHMYYNYIQIISDEFPLYLFIEIVSWATMFMAMLLFIFIMCLKTKRESDLTIVLLNRKYMQKNRKHMLPVIRQATLQTSHQKVIFSVCGMFAIDFEFLSLMLAATLTHVVILIQFYESKQNQSTVDNSTLS